MLHSEFKAPSGQRFTKALFYEMNNTGNKDVIKYTLKNKDHIVGDQVYISLYLRYLELEDLTEFEFANTYFDDYSHWELLCNSTWFKPFIEQWRKELHLKLSAKALRRIMAESKSNSKEAIACNKYLLEKGWVPKDQKNTRGRPSKQELEETKKQIIQAEKELEDDFLRISTNQLVN